MVNGKPGAGRKKGTKKTGGRKPGVKNRVVVSPVTLDLIQVLKDRNFEPAAEMVKLHAEAMALYKTKMKAGNNGWGANPALDSARHALEALMRYTYPTRKAIEHTGAGGGPIMATFIDFVKAIADDDANSNS